MVIITYCVASHVQPLAILGAVDVDVADLVGGVSLTAVSVEHARMSSLYNSCTIIYNTV